MTAGGEVHMRGKTHGKVMSRKAFGCILLLHCLLFLLLFLIFVFVFTMQIDLIQKIREFYCVKNKKTVLIKEIVSF